MFVHESIIIGDINSRNIQLFWQLLDRWVFSVDGGLGKIKRKKKKEKTLVGEKKSMESHKVQGG